MFSPAYENFLSTWNKGVPQVVFKRFISDLETPVSVLLKLGADCPYTFLLESVEKSETRGRYSVVALKPDLIWRTFGARSEINRSALLDPKGPFDVCEGPPLEVFRDLLRENSFPLPKELPPMSAGFFGYMGYDMAAFMEEKANILPKEGLEVPDSLFVRPTIVVIFDQIKQETTVITPVYPDVLQTPEAAYHAACQRIEACLFSLRKPLLSPLGDHRQEVHLVPASNTTRAEYQEMVARAKRYISAGDIFQVVLSQRFSIDFSCAPVSLYRALRRINPSPFLYYLNMEGFCLTGSSPEILVRLRGKQLTIRPIAGTRPRGKTPEEDQALSQDLLSDPKECAEHLMLLDLGRNDVGRVAEVGSVSVTERFDLEFYSQVMHIVSNVEGVLDVSRYDVLDALSAGFPAGTVSGAPKVRAMEIISELECEKRGVYAGGVGYFSVNGDMDTCIVLRTALLKNGKMYVQAGAGIVADSEPEKEYQECVNKAKAVFRAAEEAFALERGTNDRFD